MGIFPIYFNKYKLTVDEVYLISNGKEIVEAQLIHSTPKGFNFLNLETKKLMFKKHLYSLEIVKEGMKEFTFQIIKYIVIKKK